MASEIEIRPERAGDEEALDCVNCLAFSTPDRPLGGGLSEAVLVRWLRDSHPAFDPRLSLVAWAGDEAIGHVLLLPAFIRLMGRTVAALAVGPLAVTPLWQRRGVGGSLLRRGHELGRKMGYEIAFLFGHPEYYPRHGYVPCFGLAQATFNLEELPQPTRAFSQRPVQQVDAAWLAGLYRRELDDVDFGWLWGEDVREWRLGGVQSLVWLDERGDRLAYTLRVRDQWHALLADDPRVAREVLATIRPTSLSHHPSGWLARNALDSAWSACTAEPSAAAMAYELRPGTLQPYLAATRAGGRPVGACNYPLPYLLC